MTPKEKANELVSKFIDYTNLFNPDNPENNGWEKDIDASKQCALIAVDEILKALEDYDDITEKHLQSDFSELYSSQLQNMDWDFRYWQQVKTEIEAL